MGKMNIYLRKDGRYEGRIPDGKTAEGKRKFLYIFAKTKSEVVEKIESIVNKKNKSVKCEKQLV